jgi:predicted nucleic acid-binding protein
MATTMGDDPRVLLDTSVLVAAVDQARDQHAASRAVIESCACVLTAQSVREFLVVATRPVAVNGLGLRPEHAIANIAAIRRLVRLLPEERPILTELLRLIAARAICGKRIHDAAIAATARVHGVTLICTLNPKDFAGLEVEVVAPAMLVG